ncbi:MAG: HAMP domain-containing histidine kinase [Muribaculaceae bacterium]|nr:HAMP domain-containing histidine kinase [Muribaculaceae bacterium]
MGLKKHINYQWRLLLPLLLLVWLIVIILGIWMFHNEKKLRVDKLRTQITLVNSRIVAAYDSNTDPADFLDFVKDYYRQNPVYDDIRMSVYHTGTLIYQIGEPIQVPETRDLKTGGISNAGDTQFDTNESRRESNFYYDVLQSRDRKLLVYTMLPFSPEVVAASSASKSIYAILISVAVIATLIAIVIAHRIGKNISMLRDFAMRAGSDPTFVPSMAFPRDEIGDIARQIVKFYNERSASIIKLKREHKVAMHALEEKTRLKRELTNNINHELKTPIGVIKGYLDTINEHPDMDEDSRRHFMQKVGEHVNRLTQLLDDLSSITRLEYGSKMINTEPVDFHEVVFQAVSDLETSGIL